MKKALITGITGQDGSFLAEFLLEKGYEVHGITRRASISNTARIDHLLRAGSITLHDGDLSDSISLIKIIGDVQPDEIYNLAAHSHVQVESLVLPRRQRYIRLLHPSFTARLRRFLSQRPLHSIHTALMRLQSSMVSG